MCDGTKVKVSLNGYRQNQERLTHGDQKANQLQLSLIIVQASAKKYSTPLIYKRWHFNRFLKYLQ
jgi:hypothetical protein